MEAVMLIPPLESGWETQQCPPFSQYNHSGLPPWRVGLKHYNAAFSEIFHRHSIVWWNMSPLLLESPAFRTSLSLHMSIDTGYRTLSSLTGRNGGIYAMGFQIPRNKKQNILPKQKSAEMRDSGWKSWSIEHYESTPMSGNGRRDKKRFGYQKDVVNIYTLYFTPDHVCQNDAIGNLVPWEVLLSRFSCMQNFLCIWLLLFFAKEDECHIVMNGKAARSRTLSYYGIAILYPSSLLCWCTL